MSWNHGTATGYASEGCRCDACTAAQRERMNTYRNSVREPFQHGASGYSNDGCRCDICTAANAARLKEWRARRLAGQATRLK